MSSAICKHATETCSEDTYLTIESSRNSSTMPALWTLSVWYLHAKPQKWGSSAEQLSMQSRLPHGAEVEYEGERFLFAAFLFCVSLKRVCSDGFHVVVPPRSTGEPRMPNFFSYESERIDIKWNQKLPIFKAFPMYYLFVRCRVTYAWTLSKEKLFVLMCAVLILYHFSSNLTSSKGEH